MSPGADPTELVFYEDKRALWRVTWTLGLGFLLVSGVARETGALAWPLFAGIAALLVGIGLSALRGRARPLAAVLPDGLRVYAGRVGLGGAGEAAESVIPWKVVTGIGFEQRSIASAGREGRTRDVTVLCFELDGTLVRPDGHRGFLEKLAGRHEEWALGEHFVWNPARRKVDLLARPRGGHAALTAAIARVAPALGDASENRRVSRLEGPIVHALYDALLTVAVVLTSVLLATDRMGLYTRLAEHLLAWGGRVPLS